MTRRIVILILAVGGLAALLFLWDKPRESRQQALVDRQLELRSLIPSNVDSLILERPAGRVTLARRTDGWWLIDPVHEKASDKVVEGQLDFLHRSRAQRLVTIEVDTLALDAFGLGGLRPATTWIETADSTGSRARVYLGRKNPTGTSVYLREAAKTRVMLVDPQFLSMVENAFDVYRIYDLFPVGMDDIDALAVAGPAGRWSARRDDRGLWFTRESPPRQVKRYWIRPILYDLSTARVRRYVQDEVLEGVWAGYGLHDPILDISFESPQLDGRVRVGNQDEEYVHFARRDQNKTVITTSAQILANAEVTLQELLERNPVPENYDLLDSLTVRWHTGESLAACRDGDAWFVRRPLGYEGELGRFRVSLQNLLAGVESLEALDSVELEHEEDRSEYLSVHKVDYILYWSDRTVTVELGWRRGENAHWLYVQGGDRVYRTERDLYFRLRGILLVGELIDPGS